MLTSKIWGLADAAFSVEDVTEFPSSCSVSMFAYCLSFTVWFPDSRFYECNAIQQWFSMLQSQCFLPSECISFSFSAFPPVWNVSLPIYTTICLKTSWHLWVSSNPHKVTNCFFFFIFNLGASCSHLMTSPHAHGCFGEQALSYFGLRK